jgi:hypothetical protein
MHFLYELAISASECERQRRRLDREMESADLHILRRGQFANTQLFRDLKRHEHIRLRIGPSIAPFRPSAKDRCELSARSPGWTVSSTGTPAI